MDHARGPTLLTHAAPAPHRRYPIACGALGRYTPARFRALAQALGAQPVHQADNSALACDPEPMRWRRGLLRGWAWGGQPLRPRERASSWRDAACELGSCGLVVSPGRRPFVHSSVSGTAPLYWIEEDEAIYFASRIDPLVHATSRSLSVDWDAWAAVLSIYQPIGDHTPFAEVRRLRPFCRLEHDRRSGAHVTEEPWPWAAIEPQARSSEAIGEAAGAMRAVIGRLDPGPTCCLLSGGRDSRLALALLRERTDLDVRAYSLPQPSGHSGEEEVARRVAASLGVPLELVRPSSAGRWERIEERAVLCDHQFARAPWLSAIVPRLAGRPGAVADGLGLDQWLPVWRVGDPSLMTAGGGRQTTRHLWRLYHRPRLRGMLTQPLERALVASARKQFLAETERFRGHPQEIILSAYWVRTVRGVSTVPTAILGHGLEIVTPFVDHDVVRALMSVPADDKAAGHASAALVEAIDGGLSGIPTARDLPRPPSDAPAKPWLPPADIRAHSDVATDGPLGAYLDPRWRAGLVTGSGSPAEAHWANRLHGLVLFSLWHSRYAGKMGAIDPSEVIA